MKREIRELHVSWGDYSYRYRVGESFSSEGWGEITKITFDQYDTGTYDTLTYNIFARKRDLSDEDEHLAKKIQGLPVEVTYKP